MPDKEKKKSKDYFTYYWYAFSVILAYIFYKYIYLDKVSSYGIFDWQWVFILICLINLIFGILIFAIVYTGA